MAIGRPISLTPNIATKNISGIATADQTEFTVTGGYRINELAVYRNGVRLAEGRDFTASDGDTVNLVTGATADDVIEFAVFDSFNIADAIVSAASSQNLNGDFNVTGNLYAGTFEPGELVVGISTASAALHVGSALTSNAAGDVETIGIITAASFSGDGSALTGIANTAYIVSVATTTADLNVTSEVKIGTAVTIGSAGIVSAAGCSVEGALTGSTVSVASGTFSGAVNIDATTDSTSTTTGALIVDGGAAIAKNAHIGGQLQVGVAYSVGAAGVATAAGFVGPLTGNVTGDLTGTVNTAAQTSITSVGTLAGLTVGSAGELKVGTAFTMASTSGVATFADGSATSNALHFGSSQDMHMYHDGSGAYIKANTGTLYLQTTNGTALFCSGSNLGYTSLYYSGSSKLTTTDDGISVTGIITATGAHFDSYAGPLREECKIVSGKLSDNTNINITDGMVHYFTTQETTTCTPNIRFNSTKSLNNMMDTNEVITLTVITTAAAAGYSANWTIDGSAVTEEWVGGSAPSAGGSNGLDIYSFTIIKTANATFKVIANSSNAT